MSWTPLLASDAVAPGEVRSVEIGEVDLVVWRTADGRPVVMDARCPHQWSHLEAEGVVDGDEIVCTSHFWRFAADGHGSKLNVLGRRDDKSGIPTYPCREAAGWLQADLDADHGAGLDGPCNPNGPAGVVS